MTPVIEARLQGLPGRFDKRRAVLDECDADVVRTCSHRDALFQILVEQRIVPVSGPLNREGCHRLPIDEQNQLVRTRFSQARDIPAQIARKPDLDVVVAVLRERVGHRRAAARADRQTGHMIFLRQIGRQPNGVGLQRRLCAADRETADFLRGRNVAVQERRRKIADRDVVEAVSAVIRWQQRRGVDVERQQVSDGVLIFGSIQATERLRATGVRFGGGSRIELSLQPCQQRATIVLRRLRHAGRGHGARVHLAHHLLPDFRLRTRVGKVDPVQRSDPQS